MRVALVLAALVAVAVAKPLTATLVVNADPPKPKFEPQFYADVDVELHRGDEATLFGEGAWLSDFSAKKSLEDYKFREEGHLLPFYSYNLQRGDLGQRFEIESFSRHTCEERQISEFPNPWDFLNNATYQGRDQYRKVDLDIWGASFGDVHIRVGVEAPHYTTPVFLEAFGHHGGNRVYFKRFIANATLDAKYFDIPQECQSAAPVAAAAPAAPKISATFVSEFDIEAERKGEPFRGEGKWAASAAHKAEVSESRIGGREHSEVVYELALFAEHKLYQITSEDKTECRESTTSRNFTAPFAWTEHAKFVGSHHVERFGVIDIFEYHVASNNLTIGVSANNTNIPLFFGREGRGIREHVFFRHFEPTEIDAKDLVPPSECKKN